MPSIPQRAIARKPKYRAPNPGTRVRHAVDAGAASRAIYDGRDRLGSYRTVGEHWVATDRLGKPIGEFDSELAAVDAVLAVGRQQP